MFPSSFTNTATNKEGSCRAKNSRNIKIQSDSNLLRSDSNLLWSNSNLSMLELVSMLVPVLIQILKPRGLVSFTPNLDRGWAMEGIIFLVRLVLTSQNQSLKACI